MKQQTDHETGYAWSRLKSGKRGNRLIFEMYEFCPYNKCEECGRMGGLHRVRTRGDVWGWTQLHDKDWSFKPRDMLCTACWARIGTAYRAKKAADELAALAKKLLREIAKHGHESRRIARELDGLHREG